jgi:hypothetical protein
VAFEIHLAIVAREAEEMASDYDWRTEIRAELADRRARAKERDYVGYALVAATIFVGGVLALLLLSF